MNLPTYIPIRTMTSLKTTVINVMIYKLIVFYYLLIIIIHILFNYYYTTN